MDSGLNDSCYSRMTDKDTPADQDKKERDLELRRISVGNMSSFMEPSDRSLNPQESVAAHLSNMEKKHMKLQKRMIVVEQENNEMRQKLQNVNNEVSKLFVDNEDLRTREQQVQNASVLIQKRITEEVGKERMAMQKELAAYRNDLADEMDQKDKRVVELEQEIALIKRQHQLNVERLQNELDEAKEQASFLKKNEAMVEVYKKKVDQMADMRAELTDA